MIYLVLETGRVVYDIVIDYSFCVFLPTLLVSNNNNVSDVTVLTRNALE